MTNIDELMDGVDEGDLRATEELIGVLYDELRRLARSGRSKERTSCTRQVPQEAADGATKSWAPDTEAL